MRLVENMGLRGTGGGCYLRAHLPCIECLRMPQSAVDTSVGLSTVCVHVLFSAGLLSGDNIVLHIVYPCMQHWVLWTSDLADRQCRGLCVQTPGEESGAGGQMAAHVFKRYC